MSWTYIQSNGAFLRPDGRPLAKGYSGHWDGVSPLGGGDDHRYRPADQNLKNLGPIPVGEYTIGEAYSDPGGKGPVVMPLTPNPANTMFGRSAFLIHGDRAPPKSGTASDGCIILGRDSRDEISGSTDRTLNVIAYPAAVSQDLIAAVRVPSKSAVKPPSAKAAKKASPTPARRAVAKGAAKRAATKQKMAKTSRKKLAVPAKKASAKKTAARMPTKRKGVRKR